MAQYQFPENATIGTLVNFDLSTAVQEAYVSQEDDLTNLFPGSITPQAEKKVLSKSHRRRAAKRQAERVLIGHSPTQDTVDKIIHSATYVYVPSSILDLDHIRGAMTGPALRFKTKAAKKSYFHTIQKPRSLSELMHNGYAYFKWEYKPLVLLDKLFRVAAVFTGSPDDPSWLFSANHVTSRLIKLSEPFGNVGPHKRGPHLAINAGSHAGSGLVEPVKIKLDSDAANCIGEIFGDDHFQRFGGFQSSGFQLWYPDMYSYYDETMVKLYNHLPHLLPRNFKYSVFPGFTINLGGNVACFRHRDNNNLGAGICTVTPFGRFDHTRSAQLVLDEAKAIIEFPSAITAYILSASFTHSNLPLQPNEIRFSMTQYAAGPIFRFVQNGCQTEAKLKALDYAEWERLELLKDTAWQRGIDRIPHIGSIIER